MVVMSAKTPKRTAAGNLRDKDMLFKAPTSRNEIGIQTDQGSCERKPATSRKAVRMESAEEGLSPSKSEGDEDFSPVKTDKPFDPDAYKEDWEESITYKKAMIAQAIKLGLNYGSEFEYEEDVDEQMLTVKDDNTVTNYG
jgi:hypothetical protein